MSVNIHALQTINPTITVNIHTLQSWLIEHNDNPNLKVLSFDHNGIGDEGAKILADCIRRNITLTNMFLVANNITGLGAELLAYGLHYNDTLMELDLADNDIGDLGTKALAKALSVNKTLMQLDLRNNHIGDEGANALAHALQNNTVLTTLDLQFNSIDNDGATALANAVRGNAGNAKLIYLDLGNNNIGDKGANALVEAVRHNATLARVYLSGNYMARHIFQKIDAMTRWNEVGALSPYQIMLMPPICKDRLFFLLMILNKLPIADDLHWHVMCMLKVRDVVNEGIPENSSTWT